MIRSSKRQEMSGETSSQFLTHVCKRRKMEQQQMRLPPELIDIILEYNDEYSHERRAVMTYLEWSNRSNPGVGAYSISVLWDVFPQWHVRTYYAECSKQAWLDARPVRTKKDFAFRSEFGSKHCYREEMVENHGEEMAVYMCELLNY